MEQYRKGTDKRLFSAILVGWHGMKNDQRQESSSRLEMKA